MRYPALRVTGGANEGKRIPFTTGIPLVFSSLGAAPIKVGSEVNGPGRLQAAGVAPHHADLRCMDDLENEGQFQAWIELLDSDVIVNGETNPKDTAVKAGDQVSLGDCRLVMEMVEGLPPAMEAFEHAIEQAADGGRPYRSYVQFEPESGEKTVGLLSAGQGMVGLNDQESRPVFEVPLAELKDVSFPDTAAR